MGISYKPNNAEKKSQNFLGLIVFLLIIFTSAAYFFQINSISSLGFEMKAYQRDVDSLKNDNQKMKVTIAESASFKNIGDAAAAEKLNLVSVSDYQYLSVSPSSSLARR